MQPTITTLYHDFKKPLPVQESKEIRHLREGLDYIRQRKLEELRKARKKTL